MATVPINIENPVESFLRMDRIPHIWCPGCGIGTSVNCFTRALVEINADLDNIAIVSGIGCTGRVSGYLKLDSFHTTHGRAIPFATGLKLANPRMKVVVYSGDGDLFAIGGNHFIHAARRNIDLKVICVNNLTYAMTGGQSAPTTPQKSVSTTAPYGVYEPPFNLPHLAEASGATYVARWTTFHVKQLTKAIKEIMNRTGFSFIEVVTPCPTLFQRRNKQGDGLAAMKMYKEFSVTKHGCPTNEACLEQNEKIIVGKFLEKERPSYLGIMKAQFTASLGERYVCTEELSCQ